MKLKLLIMFKPGVQYFFLPYLYISFVIFMSIVGAFFSCFFSSLKPIVNNLFTDKDYDEEFKSYKIKLLDNNQNNSEQETVNTRTNEEE